MSDASRNGRFGILFLAVALFLLAIVLVTVRSGDHRKWATSRARTLMERAADAAREGDRVHAAWLASEAAGADPDWEEPRRRRAGWLLAEAEFRLREGKPEEARRLLDLVGGMVLHPDDRIDLDRIAARFAADAAIEAVSISAGTVRLMRAARNPPWVPVGGPEPAPALFESLTAGSYLLLFEAEGGVEVRFPVRLTAGESLHVEVVLPAGDRAPAGMAWIPPAGEGDGVGGFWIDRLEVTVGEFQRYLRETGRAFSGGLDTSHPSRPVTGVTFEEAAAYAAWAGKRLPTATEWTRAALGTDARRFPWGDFPDPARANVAVPGGRRALRDAGSTPSDESPYGLLDMTGNVSEWVADTDGREGWHLRRGGAWNLPLVEGGWLSGAAAGDARHDNLGFRCAKK